MHAVYPKLTVDEVVKMTADDLIAYDPSKWSLELTLQESPDHARRQTDPWDHEEDCG